MRRSGDQRDRRRSRWDEHRAARREELIAAVVAAVQALGASVGMDDIAAHAGVAKPVFYRYFADKADLQLAVGRSLAEVVVRRVTAALDEAPTARGKVAGSIDAYLRLVEADPELYRYVVRSTGARRPGDGDPVEDYATVVGLYAATVIGDLLRGAGGDAGAAEPWGFALVGMVRQAADRWLSHPTMTRSALTEYLADLAVPGLLAATTTGAGRAADGA